MAQKQGCAAGCLTIIAAAVVIGLLSRSPDAPKTNPPPVPVSPHEQRLADLRKKRESLAVSTAVEIELGRSLARDAMKLSMEPFPDPGERQFLIDKMDEQRRRAAESLEELNRVNAEIAKEEGQQQSASGPIAPQPQPEAEQPTDSAEQPLATPSPTAAASPPTPPVEAAKPTSGVLCNGVISVPQNEELTFKNLPGERLKFTFDHNAWTPTITRQPDGTQSLVMRSIKPGIQTKCDMRWEIVQ
jgi:hypothetical protein